MVLTRSMIKPCKFLQITRQLIALGGYSRTPTSRSYHTLQRKDYTSNSNLSNKERGRVSLSSRLMYRSYKQEMSQQTSESDFVFRQLLEHKSFTLTYLLADKESKEAILIDPVIDTVERDIKVIAELGLNLKYALNTHVHADHITGTGQLKKKIPGCKSVIAAVSGAKADVFLSQGDFINFGKFKVEARNTPGHTNGCLTYVWHEKGMVFSGDAVLIRGCGRTDFQEGSPDTLYESIYKNIFSLPETFLIYPAHDYTGQTVTSVGEEKHHNPRLAKTKEEFVKIMKNLNLAYPKQIDKALPANLVCGIFDVPPSD